MAEQRSVEEQNDHEDTLALRPISAMCCMITSLFTKWPDCLGIRGKGEFICFQQDFICCKPSEVEKEICVFQQIKCVARKPTVCCKMNTQAFCFDSRCALPNDESVPCILNYLGLNCFYKFQTACGCCMTIKEMSEKIGEEQTNVPGK